MDLVLSVAIFWAAQAIIVASVASALGFRQPLRVGAFFPLGLAAFVALHVVVMVAVLFFSIARWVMEVWAGFLVIWGSAANLLQGRRVRSNG